MGDVIDFNTLYSKQLSIEQLRETVGHEIACGICRANRQYPGVFDGAYVNVIINSEQIDELELNMKLGFTE